MQATEEACSHQRKTFGTSKTCNFLTFFYLCGKTLVGRRKKRKGRQKREGRSEQRLGRLNFVDSSVLDPWHFGTDPEPWIRTLDYRYGSCSFRQCQLFCSLLSLCTFTLFAKKKVLKSQNSSGRFFRIFSLLDRRIYIRVRINNYGSGSRRSKKALEHRWKGGRKDKIHKKHIKDGWMDANTMCNRLEGK